MAGALQALQRARRIVPVPDREGRIVRNEVVARSGLRLAGQHGQRIGYVFHALEALSNPFLSLHDSL